MLQKLIGDCIFRCAIERYEKDGIEIRFNLPQGISINGKHLFVADTNFHRILIWNEIRVNNEIPPDIVPG